MVVTLIIAFYYSEEYYKQVDLKQLKKAGYWTTQKKNIVKTEEWIVK